MDIGNKLQIKRGMRVSTVAIPDAVNLELPADCEIVVDPSSADAVIVFAMNRSTLSEAGTAAFAAARRGGLSWICYPKAGQLGTDLNRDSLRAAAEEEGIRPVRQVSINDVWSALRFRPAD